MVKQEKSAGCIVYYIDDEPKFLLLKYKTYWGFAKGMIEENETEEDTAIRELKEEAGIKAELVPGFKEKQRWFYNFQGELRNKEAVFFLARTSKQEAGRTKISFEHEEFAWLLYEDAIKKMKIKANKELLKKAYEFVRAREKQKQLF